MLIYHFVASDEVAHVIGVQVFPVVVEFRGSFQHCPEKSFGCFGVEVKKIVFSSS